MGGRDGTRRNQATGGILKSFSREVAPRNKVICEGAMAKACASRPATAAVALPSSGLARTFIKTRPASISTPSLRAPGVTRTESRPSGSAKDRSATADGRSVFGRAMAYQCSMVRLGVAYIVRNPQLHLVKSRVGQIAHIGGGAATPQLARRDALAGR